MYAPMPTIYAYQIFSDSGLQFLNGSHFGTFHYYHNRKKMGTCCTKLFLLNFCSYCNVISVMIRIILVVLVRTTQQNPQRAEVYG